MKNLANCKPSEFLAQTNRLMKTAERFLTVTDIMNIRKRLPKGMPELTADLSVDETEAVKKKRKEMLSAQLQKNLGAIFDAILEEHPAETLELLALCCFVEPANVDDHTMSEYLGAILDMAEDENVVRFFTLLTHLEV